jgi:hypothetical protein
MYGVEALQQDAREESKDSSKEAYKLQIMRADGS